tara:strand:+ start:600 stop:878 length:279 start_codon:yes stop_codon:yes gene_type:complete
MNKSEITTEISNKNSLLSKVDIETSTNLILNFISTSLSKGDRIEIRGFGSFSVRSRKKRIARNPKTGKAISISNKNHPYFRASKNLKETINN